MGLYKVINISGRGVGFSVSASEDYTLAAGESVEVVTVTQDLRRFEELGFVQIETLIPGEGEANTILHGAGLPDPEFGKVGDFYIDTNANQIYGPKSVTSWPSPPVSIVGPAGVAGPQGPTGAQGPEGAIGPQGLQGVEGPVGPKGDQGAASTILGHYDTYSEFIAGAGGSPGNPGDAYIVDTHLYVWSANSSTWEDVGQIVGPAGPIGPAGPQGSIGPEGPQGEIGPIGPQGIQGIPGPVEDTGVTAASYGLDHAVATFTVNSKGQLTAADTVEIQIAESQVTNLVTDLSSKADKTTSISAGTGLSGGGDLSTSRTISMPSIGSAGVYGSASQVPVITTDAQGRVSSAVDTSIQITESQVTSLITDLAAKADKTTTISAGSGLTGGGDLSTSRTISMPNVGTASTYGSASQVPVFTTDSQGRVSSATNTSIQIATSQVTGFNAAVDSEINSYLAASGRYTLKGYQVFTTAGAGTYTPTAGTTHIDLILVGAGGGGGGAAGLSSNTAAGGGGGGGGCIKSFVALTGAASYAFTVGSGGSGGSTSGGNGNNGGATTFTVGANVYTATTGQGGKGQTTPGTAPTSTSFAAGGNGANVIASPLLGTYLNLPGSEGNSGYILNGSCAIPGLGGGSYFGAGGAVNPAGGNGSNGAGYGAGGGGGYSTTNAGKSGGNGANGLVIVAEYA